MQKINPKISFFIVIAFLIFLIFLFRNTLLGYYVQIVQQLIINDNDIKEFVGGKVLLTECKDSDSVNKQNEQYIKGSISYTNKNGESSITYDRCLPQSSSILEEAYCYPREDGYFVLINEQYQCKNGCIDGACQK